MTSATATPNATLDLVQLVIEYVVHLAAITGVDFVLRMPVTTMEVNILEKFNVLQAVRACTNLKRFVDFSTSEGFGVYACEVREGDITSLGAVGEARWTYAVSKLATEHLAHNYCGSTECPPVDPAIQIFGPGRVGEGAIHRFIVQALNGEDFTIHNDGSQVRARCFVGAPSPDKTRDRSNRGIIGRAWMRIGEYPVSFAEMVVRHDVCTILVNA